MTRPVVRLKVMVLKGKIPREYTAFRVSALCCLHFVERKWCFPRLLGPDWKALAA